MIQIHYILLAVCEFSLIYIGRHCEIIVGFLLWNN